MDHLAINSEGWDKRTLLHLDSDFYQHDRFMTGETSLKEIELALLGNIEGESVLHLQCHFGQDSISLAKMGAQVTAVDLSPVAIDKAKKIAFELNADVRFICSDVMASNLLKDEKFDMVFITYGAIPWLEDLKPWAEMIKNRLKPGGRLVMVEFHPVVHMFDDDMQEMAYSYFREAAIVGDQQGSYAESDDEHIPYVVWNHSLQESIGSLIEVGLRISHFSEYAYSPYPCFAGMEERANGRYVIARFGDKIPLCFSIVATA